MRLLTLTLTLVFAAMAAAQYGDISAVKLNKPEDKEHIKSTPPPTGALASALRRELPEAEFVSPDGGYFMWVTLPAGTDVRALHHAASELGVSFVVGTDFMLEGGENTLRLAYSGVTADQIDEGVGKLAEAYRSVAVAA